jgi:serine/threonine protein kinase
MKTSDRIFQRFWSNQSKLWGITDDFVIQTFDRAVHKKIEPKRNLYAASPSESKTTNPEIVFQEGDLQNLKKIAFQLISAVYILHQEGIIHADIKPENCFISIPSSSHPGSSMNGNPSLPKNPFYHPNNPRPMQNNWMGSSDNSFFSNNNTNFTGFTFLRQLPANFEVKLADFSNSIQTSEISLYYEEFAIQSAPYRAPEVLIGIPFTPSIDVWSIGIILLELCLTKAFIATDNRLEIIQLLENKIGKFSKIRFSGGKYSHVLFESKVLSSSTISFPSHSSSSSSTFTSPTMLPSSSSSSSYSQSNSLGSPLSSSTHPPMTSSYSMSAFQKENPNNYRIDTMKALKRLLSKTIQFDLSNYQLHQFLDFLSCLLMIDPTYRMSPKDALQHAFFTSVISMPIPLCVPFTSNENEMKKKRLRNNKNNSSSTISFASLNNSLTATPSSGTSSGLSTSMNNSVGLSGSKRLLLSFDPSPARKKAATTGQSYVDLIEAKP